MIGSGEKWRYMVNTVLGQYTVRLGEKSRVAFPKKFRQVLGDTIIITYGFEGSLIIVAESNWTSLLEGTEKSTFLLSSNRDAKRFLLGGAAVVELDAQGRFIVPDYLKKFAQLEDTVTFVGQDKYVELWSNSKWEEYSARVQNDINGIVENLLDNIKKN